MGKPIIILSFFVFLLSGCTNSCSRNVEETTSPPPVVSVEQADSSKVTLPKESAIADVDSVAKQVEPPKQSTAISKREVIKIKPVTKVEKVDEIIKKEIIEDIEPDIHVFELPDEIVNIKNRDTVSTDDITFQRTKRYFRVGKPGLFMPKGQWMVGATVSYQLHNASDYKFLIVDDIKGRGYMVDANVYGGYALARNTIVGAKFGFTRSLIDLKTSDIKLNDDLNFDLSDTYNLTQSFYGSVFMRNFIPIFDSKQFALFNDLEIGYDYGRGKMVTGSGDALTGTYQRVSTFAVTISPGIMAFINDNTAFEVSLGVLGFKAKHIYQNTNQVYFGSREFTSAKLGVNILSIKFGMSLYFNSPKNLLGK